jgi:hypothetical protein
MMVTTLLSAWMLLAQFPSDTTQRVLLKQCGDKAFAAKQWDKVEQCIGSYIAGQPNDGYAAYELGTALLMTRDPTKMAEGMFYYARAAHLMKEAGLKVWVKREYTNIYRSPLGLDRYWEFVRTHGLAPDTIAEYPRPPDDMFGGMSLVMAELRRGLEGPNAAQFFEDVLGGSSLPVMRGKLVAQKPEGSPKELFLSVETPGEADVRIILNKALPHGAPLGTSIDFEGIIKSWDKQPFAIVFDVPSDGLHGWPAN